MVDELALNYLQGATNPRLAWLADQYVSFELDGLLVRQ
jgi:hypothetical protein